MKNLILLVSICLLLGSTGCTPSQTETKTDKVVLQLKWVHQAQFAGFYLAQSKGFYHDEKLDVSFLPGGKNIDQCEQLSSGKADFAITSGDTVLIKRQLGQPLVAIAVLYQRSAVAFVAKTATKIATPMDFRGKTIAVGNMEGGGFVEAWLQFKALMNKAGIGETDYITVPYDPLYKAFVDGKADITPAYLTAGVIKLRTSGQELNIIWPGDYGIDFYCDTLVTTADYLQQNTSIAERFLRASLKGWQYAIEHSDEAVEATMAYAEIKDKAVQKAMFAAQVPLIHTGVHPIGWMEPEVWRGMHEIMVTQGILPKPLTELDSIYSLALLKSVYPPATK